MSSAQQSLLNRVQQPRGGGAERGGRELPPSEARRAQIKTRKEARDEKRMEGREVVTVGLVSPGRTSRLKLQKLAQGTRGGDNNTAHAPGARAAPATLKPTPFYYHDYD